MCEWLKRSTRPISAWNLIPGKATQHHHTEKRIANAQQDVHHEQTEQVEELGNAVICCHDLVLRCMLFHTQILQSLRQEM